MAYFIGTLIGGLMLISVTTPALADKNKIGKIYRIATD
jgi:hypothetical protein